MTPHLTGASLAAALDRDGGAAAETARLHTVNCEACRRVLEAAEVDEAEVGRLLHSLDRAPPEIDAAQFVRSIASRGNRRNVGVPRSRSWTRHAVRWTAGAGLLTVAAVAAALVPNSSVRRFIGLIAAAPLTHGSSSTAHSESSAGQASLPRGVGIIPNSQADILFRSRQAAGAVRVIATTAPQLSVAGDRDGPTYTVGENTILVNNQPSDSVNYTVLVPTVTGAAAIYVRIAGRVVYSHVGNRVNAQIPAESSGKLLLPLRSVQH